MQGSVNQASVPLTLLAILAVMVGCQPVGETAPSQGAGDQRPNILLVLVDDMGFTDVGAFGGEIDTPNIDALAAAGIRFTDFHTSVSCSPTRSMLLTGTDNHIAGLGNMGELMTPNQEGQPGYEGHLNDRVVTLQEVLSGAGYATFMAGKWHLGHVRGSYPGDRGFDRSLALLFGGASHWSDMQGLIEGQTPAEFSQDGELIEELPDDFFSSCSYTDFLMDAVRTGREPGQPFLAYLSFQAPHDPLHVPEPWLSKYEGRYDDGYEALKQRRLAAAKQQGVAPAEAESPPRHQLLPAWESLSAEEKRYQSRMMEVYAGMVENMDYHLGRMIDFLKDIGEYENTLVIFTSDNGANPWVTEEYPGNAGSQFVADMENGIDNIGSPGSAVAYGMGWATAGGGPLDYFKMTVGEGGIHTPLIVAGAGVAGPGRIFDGFTYVMDVMPTILELAGIEHPGEFNGREVEHMRGRSVANMLVGDADPIYAADEYVGGEMGGGKWMRKGDFKALIVPQPYGRGEWELYDVSSDPGETRNLAGERPELLAELQAAWEEYSADVGVIAPQP